MEYTDISFKIYYREKTRRVKRDQQLTDNNKKSTNDRFGDVLIPRFVTVLIFVFAFFLLDRRLFYLNFKTFVSLSSEFDQLILLCTLSIFFFGTVNVFGVFIEQIGEMCWKKIVTGFFSSCLWKMRGKSSSLLDKIHTSNHASDQYQEKMNWWTITQCLLVFFCSCYY